MATQVQRPSVSGATPKKPAATRAPVKKTASKSVNGAAKPAQQRATPAKAKAASVAGDNPAQGGGNSAYAIMAGRIANRVAEMAESITFVERYERASYPTSSARTS